MVGPAPVTAKKDYCILSSELFLQKLQFTQTKTEDLPVHWVSGALKNKADLPTAKPDYRYQTAARCCSEIFNQQGKDLSNHFHLLLCIFRWI